MQGILLLERGLLSYTKARTLRASSAMRLGHKRWRDFSYNHLLMVRSFMSHFGVLLLVVGVLCPLRSAHAQKVLPRAGQDFTFGIIQGPDNLIGDSTQAQQQTTLMLTVASAYSGCGVITSP